MQEGRFQAALRALAEPDLTTIVLVTRPDKAALSEAARTSNELRDLGLANQRLVVNGVFKASDASDRIAHAIEALSKKALADLPADLRPLPQDLVPLRPFDMVGLPALRALLGSTDTLVAPETMPAQVPEPRLANLDRLVDELAASGHGLIMVMGKGGVGKTTVAAALAIGLVRRGHGVHLSTTDPAAHVAATVNGELEGLTVDRIDPRRETQVYVDRIMATRGRGLDEAGRALLREDLNSPCTEEVAVFNAFSRIVSEARSAFVVLDTAPTGHTLLLMDATGAYHRQMVQDLEAQHRGRIVTPLMRLQDPNHTKIVLVTLPETTPVSEAAALQEYLGRARIETYAWVINRTLIGSGARDPLLSARMAREHTQIDRVQGGLAKRVFGLPWQPDPPVGLAALSKLIA
jgi:arsenite-transporting ATPase